MTRYFYICLTRRKLSLLLLLHVIIFVWIMASQKNICSCCLHYKSYPLEHSMRQYVTHKNREMLIWKRFCSELLSEPLYHYIKNEFVQTWQFSYADCISFYTFGGVNRGVKASEKRSSCWVYLQLWSLYFPTRFNIILSIQKAFIGNVYVCAVSKSG